MIELTGKQFYHFVTHSLDRERMSRISAKAILSVFKCHGVSVDVSVDGSDFEFNLQTRPFGACLTHYTTGRAIVIRNGLSLLGFNEYTKYAVSQATAILRFLDLLPVYFKELPKDSAVKPLTSIQKQMLTELRRKAAAHAER